MSHLVTVDKMVHGCARSTTITKAVLPRANNMQFKVSKLATSVSAHVKQKQTLLNGKQIRV